ncbi:polyphenol oxidase [Mesorhizobium sp. Root554]|uniref:peptidoglycan editing factor PgeF n=1 Tax=unclassified Mesorhizobium TaxID=325217 RepID=UPI0006F6B434|nr:MULTISPECIES: peptidoglycan editing factor PgeF [unclassified Mesorhizobium]KQZ14250.1 polyphenol oxidase [Mesorhizobium sp. Root1471]KQZ38429.1 polyphenol oxidase [Mesorhizobium sp. Root554]
MSNQTKPDPVRSDLLEKARAEGIRHGYFTRVGGVSNGIYSGLNTGIGSADDPQLVGENRRRVAEWMGVPASHLLSAYQIHSPDVVIVREPFTERPQVDAIVTDRPGIAVGASSADCGPVLFADAKARVVAAAHAGWKGALTGVLENTVAAMESIGARRENIVAVLGPTIGPDNYEVGAEFVARFVEADARNQAYFVPSAKTGHAMFDLNRYTVDRLVKAGVMAQALNRCTYAEEDLFYSYRRTTHRREPDYGRQISAIALED